MHSASVEGVTQASSQPHALLCPHDAPSASLTHAPSSLVSDTAGSLPLGVALGGKLSSDLATFSNPTGPRVLKSSCASKAQVGTVASW